MPRTTRARFVRVRDVRTIKPGDVIAPAVDSLRDGLRRRGRPAEVASVERIRCWFSRGFCYRAHLVDGRTWTFFPGDLIERTR